MVNATLAVVQENSALASAATGELVARAIAGMLYPGVKQSDLSEEQKQTISTLATVSAGTGWRSESGSGTAYKTGHRR